MSATQSILDRIARDLREQMPEVKSTLVLAGFGGGGGNGGRIFVTLKGVDERDKSQADLINKARGITKKYSGKDYRINVSGSSSISGSLGLGRGGSGIGFYIAGTDQEKLKQYGDALVAKLEQDPLFRDPDTSNQEGSPEIQVKIDRGKAADLGVKAGDVAQALNIFAAGQRVSTFSEGTEQYDVVVQADEEYRRDRSNLQYFTVASSLGTPVGLEKLVKIEESTSPSSISRLNRQRQVTISAGLPPNTSESDALAKLENYAKELDMPAEYRTGVTGQSKELQRAYNSFMLAFLLSFVFMYLILAAQFESFIHPVTILLTLPFVGSVRASFDGDCRTDVEYFFRARHLAFIRNRQEKRHFADRSHESSARQRNGAIRSDHSGKPRPSAPDLDDDAGSGRRNDPADHRQRRGRGDQPFDRNSGRRRSINVSASDASGSSGFLFAVRRRTAIERLARIWRTFR